MLICLSIFAVEFAFLLPSYVKRHNELRFHLEMEALLAVKATLAWYEQHSPEELLQLHWVTLQHASVAGLAVYANDGRLLASRGEVPALKPPARPALSSLHREKALKAGSHPHGGDGMLRRDVDGLDAFDVVWPPEASGLPFNVVARIDCDDLSAQLTGYVLRIGGLVLILSLIVCGVTIAVLGQTVLTPILQVHRKLTAAHNDPENAEKYKLDLKADNELGETVTALNALLDRLSSLHRSHVREREERFKDFASSSSDWFWEMDENLRFSYFSERFEAVTGVEPVTLLGRTRDEPTTDDNDKETWEGHLDDLRNHRPFRDFIYPRRREDGTTLWLCINGSPVFDPLGKFCGYRGTGRDVTQQMEVKEALQCAKEEAEAANKTKSEFLANVSHELRTPLNAIIGFSEVMLESDLQAGVEPRHRGYLEDIHNSGLHLLSLINDILDLSKIEAGADELDEESLDVAEIARSVLRVVRQRAEKAGVAVEWTGGSDLPLLYADERKMKQALLNLLTNAIKFTPTGGQVSLHTSCDVDGCFVFQIADNGIGMAQEDIATALRQFGQIDSALNRKYEGTGLGLPLTKALIELHGGTLDLESRLGEGTTVTIRLPAARSGDPQAGGARRTAG